MAASLGGAMSPCSLFLVTRRISSDSLGSFTARASTSAPTREAMVASALSSRCRCFSPESIRPLICLVHAPQSGGESLAHTSTLARHLATQGCQGAAAVPAVPVRGDKVIRRRSRRAWGAHPWFALGGNHVFPTLPRQAAPWSRTDCRDCRESFRPPLSARPRAPQICRSLE